MALKKYSFDPIDEFGIEIRKSERSDALEAVASYLKDAMLEYIGDGVSPVSGFGKFPSYTKNYKKIKSEESSSKTVNLELSGEMLDALDVSVRGSKIVVDVIGDEDLRGRAEGNNLGTYGTGSPIKGKTRRFIPLKDETFKRSIQENIKRILKEFEDGEN